MCEEGYDELILTPMGQKKVTLFISEVEMHARVVLGVGKESFLERCPQFMGVLTERERGSTVPVP